jgi:hypothetical protein
MSKEEILWPTYLSLISTTLWQVFPVDIAKQCGERFARASIRYIEAVRAEPKGLYWQTTLISDNHLSWRNH